MLTTQNLVGYVGLSFPELDPKISKLVAGICAGYDSKRHSYGRGTHVSYKRVLEQTGLTLKEFNRIVEPLGIFAIADRWERGTQKQIIMLEALENALAGFNPKPSKLVWLSGRLPRSSVPRYDASRNKLPIIVTTPPDIWHDVSISGLSQSSGSNEHIERARILALDVALAHSGQLPSIYSFCYGGRAHDPYIQSLPKELKGMAFPECFDVDICAAGPSIMLHLSNLHLPVLQAYIEHTSEIRQQLSLETGIRISLIKLALTQANYGAACCPWSKRIAKNGKFTHAMHNTLGERCDAFYHAASPLLDEIKQARQAALSNASTINKGKTLVNGLGLKLATSDTVGRKLYFLNCGIEAQVLDVMNDYCHGVVSLNRDGLLCRAEPDLEELTRAIQKKTGVNVRLRVDHL